MSVDFKNEKPLNKKTVAFSQNMNYFRKIKKR
jgi:hypothetical protein